VRFDYRTGGTVELGWTAPPGAEDPAIAEAVAAARSSAVAVVFVGDMEAEGVDRTTGTSSVDLPLAAQVRVAGGRLPR
jgi:beta-glucosidase